MFTYYLLQGLQQQKDAPIDKLYEWVKEHVAQDAAQNHWKQHPVFSASDTESAIVIGTPPLNPVAGIGLFGRR